MNVITLLLGALLLPAGSESAAGATPAVSSFHVVPEIGRAPRHPSFGDGPSVRIWISGDNVFRPGEDARVYFSADQSAYVTIVRIDTDGRMDVLWPESPRDDGWIRGGRTERVRGRHGSWLRIDDDPGMGYVFAIASWDRFAYDRIRRYDDWDYRLTDYRVGGDPFIAVEDLAERIVYEGEPYTTDYATYHVGRRYDYPRFACYECHRTGHGHWDPYRRRCSTVYVVVRNDPYHHHSHGHYGGYDAYARQPRYEFKAVSAIERQTPANAIERRQRTTTADHRRPGAPDGDVDRPTRGSGGNRPNGGQDADGDRPGNGGRRRGGDGDAGGGGESPGRIGAPRRDPSGQEPGGGDSGGGDSGNEGRGPRRDPPGQGGGNGGNGNGGNGGDGGNGNGGGNGGGAGQGGGNGSPGHGRGPRRDGQGGQGNGGERDDDEHGPPDDRGSQRGGSPRRDDDGGRSDESSRSVSSARDRDREPSASRERERERESAASRPREESRRPDRAESSEPRRSSSPERRTESRRSEPRRETSRSSRPSSGSSRSSGSSSRRRP